MTVSPIFWRGTYHVRITGGRDTKRRIPASVFGDVPCDRKSKRGDRIARKYADQLENEEVMPSESRTARLELQVHRLPIDNSGVTSRDWTSRMSLAAIGALFLSSNRAILDPKTLRRYEITIGHLAAFFGDERPDEIHIGRLEDFRDHRLAAHWTPRLGTVPRRQISPRTVHSELVFAVQLLGFGFDRKLRTKMTALPVRKAPDVADRVRTRGRVLTIEEFWRAYEAAGSLQRAANRFQRLLALGLTTMLRSDALLRLVSDEGVRWVDLISRTVTVPPQFVKKGRGRVRTELTLPLCEWAAETLQSINHAEVDRLKRGNAPTEADRRLGPFGVLAESNGDATAERNEMSAQDVKTVHYTDDKEPRWSLVGCGARGEGVNVPRPPTVCTWGAPVASVQSTLNRIAQIAGIRHFSLHDIRATGATYLLNRGVQKIAVDRLIGHAMAPNDARYYQVDRLATEAVRLFDDEWNAHRGVDGVNVVAIGSR